MANPYTTRIWKNDPDPTTPLGASKLNDFETRIFTAFGAVSSSGVGQLSIAAGNLGATPSLNMSGETVGVMSGTLNMDAVLTITGMTAGDRVWLPILQDGTGGRSLSISLGGTTTEVPLATDPGASTLAVVVFDGTDFWVQGAPGGGTFDLLSDVAGLLSDVAALDAGDVKLTYGAKGDNVTNDAAAFQAAVNAGPTVIPPGTYYINGVVHVPIGTSFEGSGMATTTLRLGPSGQIRISARGETGQDGGRIGGFTVDGNGVGGGLAGGGFYIGNTLNATFYDLEVTRCTGDNVVMESAQNNAFIACQFRVAGRSSLVLDGGTGGHAFIRCEITMGVLYSLEFRQTYLQVGGGYPTFLGPSDNKFYSCIIEYPGASTLAATISDPIGHGMAPAMVYHGAGTRNQFYGSSVCPTGVDTGGTTVGLKMEAAANAKTTTATVTSGTNTITVADATGITGLMSVRGNGIPLGTFVTNVAGTTITLSQNATASGSGVSMGFGALSTDLGFDGFQCPGTAGRTTAIDMNGAATLHLAGQTSIGDHAVAFRLSPTDGIHWNGADIGYFGITTKYAAQSGTTIQAGNQIRNQFAGHVATEVDAPETYAYTAYHVGDANDNFSVTPGKVLLSDGATAPFNVGVMYNKIGSEEFLEVLGSPRGQTWTNYGFPGVTDSTRHVGRHINPGSPSGGTWKAGDWCFDSTGAIWFCTVAGSPGTWVPAESFSAQKEIILDPTAFVMDPPIATVGTWGANVEAASVGNGWTYNGSNAVNDRIDVDVALATGTWKLSLMHKADPNFGIVALLLDGTQVGTIDQYAASTAYNVIHAITGIAVPTSGTHRLSFKVTGKNASSSNWYVTLQKILLRKTA